MIKHWSKVQSACQLHQSASSMVMPNSDIQQHDINKTVIFRNAAGSFLTFQ